MMASEQSTSELRFLQCKSGNLRFLEFVCALVVIQLAYASMYVINARDSIAVRSARATSMSLWGAHLPPSRARNVKGDYDQSIQSEKQQSIIVAKIIVVSNPPFWADSSLVVMKISLQAVTGNLEGSYKEHPKITLLLDPSNAAFNKNRIEIPSGASESDPFTLTSKQPAIMDVTCTPDSEYQGPVIQSPPAKIEFLTVIDRIGIEPVSGQSIINIGTYFRVFLCNHKDLKTHLVPTTPVSVELHSQSENGTLDVKKVDLTDQHFSQDVRYVGTRMGYDTITALGFYRNGELNGNSERQIVFPWWTFIMGLLGTLIGALVRVKIGQANERLKNFLESSVCGLSIGLIIILFPVGTKIPQISNYIQPSLEFVLALLVAFFGPEFFKFLLSFIPSRS